MRKIKIIEHISLDGVIQAPGAKNEDGEDYPYGGWSVPFRHPAGGAAIAALHGESFDLLLGRRTYDMFSQSWAGSDHPLAAGINAATKYVATHRRDGLEWGPVEALGPDITAEVRRIKSQDAPDLILWGSSTLTPLLLEHGLADQISLFVYPVLLGSGKRFFAQGSAPRELALVESKAVPSGVVINTYKPNGALRT